MPFGILSKFSRTSISCPYLPFFGGPLRSNAGSQARRTIFKKAKAVDPSSCPSNESCEGEYANPIWSLFKRKKVEKQLNPDGPEYCRPEGECPPEDPDLSFLGGKAYRTCGTAYVVEKEHCPEFICEPSAEDIAVATMQAAIGRKHLTVDPLPDFRNVEQRMMDLDQRRLHPFHRRYRDVVKKRQGRVYYNPFEIPAQLKINRRLVDEKNRILLYKRINPPAEYPISPSKTKSYRKPCKIPVIPTDSIDLPQNSAVFDTLYQKIMRV